VVQLMSRRAFWFRINVLIFASILAVQAVWLVTAAFIRPMLPYFPQDKASEEKALAARPAAIAAASIGWVRGDLWTDAAIALSSGVIGKAASASDHQMTAQRNRAVAVARRAARLSPHESRVWLLLAALGSRSDRPDHEVARRLKMSYFTGPNELVLAPLRIRLATSATTIKDAELQNLVALEIRSIILRHQDKKSAVVAGYRDASPEGKKFIEATVGGLDKGFLAAITGGGRQ
jgi:hypothetical protein